MVLLDFAKAFDKVSHVKLIQKLVVYNKNGILVRWIKSFLSDRKQRVLIGENVSELETVTSSVPQESVLDRLLFTIFINDLPNKIKNQCKLYADGCKLICVVNKNEDLEDIQKNLSELHIIENTLVEKNLGIISSNDLKWVNQVEKVTSSAKSILAQIRNSFSYFDAELVKLLYVLQVRPHLEFAV